jgi:hypothetical protein
MNEEKMLQEPQRNEVLPSISGSVFIQKIWNEQSKFIGPELDDLQHCAGTNLMHRNEFNNALDKIIPSVEDAGIIAVGISESVTPKLTAQEQSFFIAGFQECIKWLLYTDR